MTLNVTIFAKKHRKKCIFDFSFHNPYSPLFPLFELVKQMRKRALPTISRQTDHIGSQLG